MNKIHQYMLKYLFFTIPAVILLIFWSFFQTQQEVLQNNNMFIYIFWEILSWHLIIWFLLLIYLLFVMLFSVQFRETFLIKLTSIKERDEREALVIEKSSRFTFFSTLAVLIVLLFFSLVNIKISKLPLGQVINGNKHQVTISASFDILKKNKPNNKNVLFSTESSPISMQGVIIFIILWHVLSFFISSRKMRKRMLV